MTGSTAMYAIGLLLLVAGCQAQQASPVQNPILAQLQGGSTDGTDDTGVFSNGLRGSNGAQLVTSLKNNISAAAPSVRQAVQSTLSSYGVSAPAPAPTFLSQLTGLPADQQESLFASLLSQLVSPASGPSQAQSQADPNSGVGATGFGDSSGNGATSSSGSKRKSRKLYDSFSS